MKRLGRIFKGDQGSVREEGRRLREELPGRQLRASKRKERPSGSNTAVSQARLEYWN